MSNEIDKEIMRVLKRTTLDGQHLQLPPDRMRTMFREQFNAVVARIGGKWRPSLKYFEFDFDPASTLEEIKFTGMMPSTTPIDYYDSPTRLITRMVDLIPAGAMRIIEPSAGEGDIVKAVIGKFKDAVINAIESDGIKHSRLKRRYSPRATVLQYDYLQLKQAKGYDCAIMHPPFITERDRYEYTDHFHHAYNMLVEGGLLIGVAPMELAFSNQGKVKALRDLITVHQGTITQLSPKMIKVKDNYIPVVLVVVKR